MLLSKYKVESYSFKEFRNQELIKEMRSLEKSLNHIKKHRMLYKQLVFIVAMMLMKGYLNPALAYATDVSVAVERLNTLCNELLSLVRTVAYWTVLLTTSKDCISQAVNGDRKGVSGAVTKGLMIMAVIYFLPELFSLMESIVSTK